MAWMDYNQAEDDLVSVLFTALTSAKMVDKEVDEIYYSFANMPLVDVRLKDSLPAIRAGQDYNLDTTFEVQITCMDLSEFSDAAILRQSLLVTAIDAIRGNSGFSAEISTSRIGAIQFASARDEDTRAFMAAVTFEVIVEAYADA